MGLCCLGWEDDIKFYTIKGLLLKSTENGGYADSEAQYEHVHPCSQEKTVSIKESNGLTTGPF